MGYGNKILDSILPFREVLQGWGRLNDLHGVKLRGVATNVRRSELAKGQGSAADQHFLLRVPASYSVADQRTSPSCSHGPLGSPWF